MASEQHENFVKDFKALLDKYGIRLDESDNYVGCGDDEVFAGVDYTFIGEGIYTYMSEIAREVKRLANNACSGREARVRSGKPKSVRASRH